MSTNPIPKGTRNLSVNMPQELHEALKELAAESSMTLSQYVRQVLTISLESRLHLPSSEEDVIKTEGSAVETSELQPA